MTNGQKNQKQKMWSLAFVAAVTVTLATPTNSFTTTTMIGPLHANSSLKSNHAHTLLASPLLMQAVLFQETMEECLESETSYNEGERMNQKAVIPTIIDLSPARTSIQSKRFQGYEPIRSSWGKMNTNTSEKKISVGKKASVTFSNGTASKSTHGKKLSGGRSSTMPGFKDRNHSGRHEAFRDGLNNARKANTKAKSDKIKKALTSSKAVTQRKKANSEAMYSSSASVPDSMIAFTNEIHQVTRITPLEEKELGQQTQESIRLKEIYERLEKELNREPTDAEWCAAAGKINMDAIQRAIDDGNEAKNRLVASNLRMVQGVVNLYIRNGLGSEFNAGDLMQEGTMALIRAAEKFEPHRGFRFSTYAMYWIRSSVKRSHIIQSRLIKVPQRIHENHKKVLKFQKDMEDKLGRPPTSAELALEVGLTEKQLERCLEAIAQQCFSLDADIENTQKPNDDGNGDTLYELIDSKYGGADCEIERKMLRADLVDTLRTHLSREKADLLLMRYGMMEDELNGEKFTKPLTIAELSRVVGLKPDKVRRVLNKSLFELRHIVSKEWSDYERDLSMAQNVII